MTEKDTRYNNPKGGHGKTTAEIDMAIDDNPIYRELRDALLNAQRGQVGYGLAKYPETLNKDSWSTLETLDHIIEESIDQLHYLIMLKLKLKADACEARKNKRDLNKEHGELMAEGFKKGFDNTSEQLCINLDVGTIGDKMLARKGIE